MRHPNLAIILILIGALCFASLGWTWALAALCIVIVLLPCKYDPAIQAKLQRESKKDQSNG